MKDGVEEEGVGGEGSGVDGDDVVEGGGMEAVGEGEEEVGKEEMVLLEAEEYKAGVDLLQMVDGRGKSEETV